MYGIAGWRYTAGQPELKSMDEMYPELKARNKQSAKMKGVAGSRPRGYIGGREVDKNAMSRADQDSVRDPNKFANLTNRGASVNYMNRGG